MAADSPAGERRLQSVAHKGVILAKALPTALLCIVIKLTRLHGTSWRATACVAPPSPGGRRCVSLPRASTRFKRHTPRTRKDASRRRLRRPGFAPPMFHRRRAEPAGRRQLRLQAGEADMAWCLRVQSFAGFGMRGGGGSLEETPQIQRETSGEGGSFAPKYCQVPPLPLLPSPPHQLYEFSRAARR